MSYDAVPYESLPFPQTHPDRLATVSHLFGLCAPDISHCRVLELGCAGGGNLLPMAMAFPNSTFLGVDLSRVQIDLGKSVIEGLGIKNIQLLQESIEKLPDAHGPFDFIIAHGVYSWVPPAIQDAILQTIAERLADNGIGYVSYNTLPGWRTRGAIRDLMRFHVDHLAEPNKKVEQARAILQFLAESASTRDSTYVSMLRSEAERLRGQPDYYIFHEHLEDANEPVYFSEFIQRAERHGLQYLAESEVGTMVSADFSPEIQDTLVRIAPDLIRQEQTLDFLRNRMFRQTLLIRGPKQIDRNLKPDRLRQLAVSGNLIRQPAGAGLVPGTPATFSAPDGGTISTGNRITQSALSVLKTAWPEAVPFDELLGRARANPTNGGVTAQNQGEPEGDTLASDLLLAYVAGLISLHTMPPRLTSRPGPFPRAGRLARWQASQGMTALTSLRHDVVRIDGSVAKLLTILDGTRSLDELCRIAATWPETQPGGAPMSRSALARSLRPRMESHLSGLAKLGLMEA